MAELDEFFITGPTPGAPNYLDWANLLNRWPRPDDGTYTPPPTETFAPPMPTPTPPPAPVPAPAPLPEVIIEAPRPVPVPLIPPLLTTIAAGAAALLFPQPIGGGDLPENATQWRPPPEPPRTAPPAAGDAPQPPNWDEMLDGFDVWGDRIDRGIEFTRNLWQNLRRFSDLLDLGREPATFLQGLENVQASRVQRISDLPELEEFVVTPPRPRQRGVTPIEVPYVDYADLFGAVRSDPGLGLEPAPRSPPGVNPAPGTPKPAPDTGRRPGLEPRSRPAPDLLGTPSPGPGNQWFFDPLTPPRVPAPPGRSPVVPRTPVRTDPVPIDDLITNLYDPPGLAPGPLRTPTKPPADACECDGGGGKKKKKKKRPERDVCYRGTYRQLRKGITYKRLEQIPCETSSSSPRRPKVSPDLRDYSPF